MPPPAAARYTEGGSRSGDWMDETADADLWLGLDTGGTYTDAVILTPARAIVAAAKALTTREDLAIGLGNAIRAVLDALPAARRAGEISLVSVSTTLATNAVVERRQSPICALLVGYDRGMLARGGLAAALAGHPVVLLKGGHRATGEQEASLDLEAAREAILAYADQVEAFAVSSLFSVRNPSHELQLRTLIRSLTGKPVTCGHELTSGLDAPRRALTAALNAQLTPQLRHLLDAVQAVLAGSGIAGRLMVVKGDGSLMAVEMALDCPVETILSGPAASVVGARCLTGRDDFVMADMGGTTTDIAVVRNGQPVLSAAGAQIGGWRTMVEAVDVHTFGLGGDSELGFDARGGLAIGPRRVVPLSLFARQHPAALDALRRQDGGERPPQHPARFAYRQGGVRLPVLRSKAEIRIWEALAGGPLPLDEIAWSPIAARALTGLVAQGVVAQAGPTPSDAMHVLGLQTGWDEAAARLGTKLLLRGTRDWHPAPDDAEIEAFCARIREQVTRETGKALCIAAFGHDPGLAARSTVQETQIDAVTAGRPFSRLLQVEYRLALPLVAIGAPVGGYYPAVAERLNAELVIPEHAAVTNAIGAVAGVVMQAVEILISQPKLELYRLHGPEGNKDFQDPEAAIAAATELSRALATAAARAAGAAKVELDTVVRRKNAERGNGGVLLIEATIRSTATGRPSATVRS